MKVKAGLNGCHPAVSMKTDDVVVDVVIKKTEWVILC